MVDVHMERSIVLYCNAHEENHFVNMYEVF